MNCFPPHREPTVPEHEPSADRARRLEREEYGEKHAAAFVAEYADLVVRLIGFGADRDAELLLNDLRDLFWSGDWTPKVTQ